MRVEKSRKIAREKTQLHFLLFPLFSFHSRSAEGGEKRIIVMRNSWLFSLPPPWERTAINFPFVLALYYRRRRHVYSLVYRLSFLGLIYLTREEPLRGKKAADKSLVNQVVLHDDNEGRLSGLKKGKDSSSTFLCGKSECFSCLPQKGLTFSSPYTGLAPKMRCHRPPKKDAPGH